MLVESVRTRLLPALIERGFTPASVVRGEQSVERKSIGTFPFALMRRERTDGGVDLVEIQFKTYQRAAFRINACAVPKDGMLTDGGHKSVEECLALGVHDLEIYANPRRWKWFSLPFWWLRPAVATSYDKLALRVVDILPELELAMRERRIGPHVRRIVMRPLPPDVLERLRRLKTDANGEVSRERRKPE